MKKGDFEQTLKYAEKSHHLRRLIYPDTSIVMIRSFINMAYANMLVYEYEQALQYLHKAELLCKSNEKDRTEEIGTIYSYYGRIYKNTGDYLQALPYMQRAEEYLVKDLTQNKQELVLHYMQFADLEMMLGNTDESLRYYQKSYDIIKKFSQNNRLLISYYTGTALTHARAGDYYKSIQLQQKAIQLARKDSSENALRLAILHNNIGLDYLEVRQLPMAETSFQLALKIFRELGVRGLQLAELYESLGMLCFYKGIYTRALEYCQKGLEITAPLMPVNQVLINPRPDQIEGQLSALKILKSKSSCLEALYFQGNDIKYLEEAINTALLTIELIDILRNSYQSYESKTQIAKHEYEIYNYTLELLNIAYQHSGEQRYKEMTFTVSERSKSSILLSVLHELDARQFGEIPDSLLEKEQRLSKYITFYKENIYEEKQSPNPDSVKISIWEQYLFIAQRKHNQLIDFFEQRYPKYFSLKYENPTISVDNLQKQLPIRTSLIEYSLSDSILFTCIITKSDFHIVKQRIDSGFYESLNGYLNTFHHFDFSKQSLNDFTEFCWTSQSLYNVLIAPVYKYINGNTLIIVPDGILSYLPFETLIRQIPDGIPSGHYRYLDYLINEFSVSYSYSATLFQQVNSRKNKNADKRLLAFAPEYSEELNERITEKQYFTRQDYAKNLFPIPGVFEEVNAIHKLISGDVFTGKLATERNFIDTAGYFDILHLAMHTVIDNNNPLYSKLIFTINDDPVYDGFLNTYEVFDLNLKARMVVLSACSTGGGEYNKGEGVISLARGFVYAGSPSMIMTMWEVEDKTSSELMKYFYKNLLKGQSKSKAMRNAKLTSIRKARPENTHPFFWSSFVVLGSSQPLFLNRKNAMFITLGVVCLSLLIFMVYRKFRIKQ